MAIFSTIGAIVASSLGFAAASGAAFATIAGIGLTATGTLVAGLVAGGLAVATAKVQVYLKHQVYNKAKIQVLK